MSPAEKRKSLILNMIPSFPDKISATEIYEALNEHGYIDHTKKDKKRNMQRDLEALCNRYYVIEKDISSKPHTYQIKQGEKHPKHKIEHSSFLAVKVIQKQVEDMMPPTFAQDFKQEFESLKHSTNKKVHLWSSRFIVINREFQPLPTRINYEYFEVIEKALLDNLLLTVNYQKRGATEPKSYSIIPNGLMLRGKDYYLIGEDTATERRLSLPLIRIKNIRCSYTVPSLQTPFDIEEYVKSDNASYFSGGEVITVTLRVEREQGMHYIYENHIGQNQTVIDESDSDYVVLTAEVSDSRSLQTWLMKYADIIEVLAPQPLREKVIRSVKRAYELYDLNRDNVK